MSIQEIRITSVLIEHFLTTGRIIPCRQITEGLPDGSRLIGCELEDFGRLLLLRFALPEGAEPSKQDAVVLSSNVKLATERSPAESRFKSAVASIAAGGQYPSPGRINAKLGRGRVHNINGRECRWRREVCAALGIQLRGGNRWTRRVFGSPQKPTEE